MNEDSTKNCKEKRKYETKEDVMKIQEMLMQMKKQIIAKAPKLELCIKNAPFYLDALFNSDGIPKGDFNVTEGQQKKVAFALKHPGHKSVTGQRYWGDLRNYGEYRIQVTPTFFSDEELDSLKWRGSIVKIINYVKIEFVPCYYQKSDFSERVEKYRENIKPYRQKLQEYDELLSLLEKLKSKLPSAPRIVTIVPDDNFGSR